MNERIRELAEQARLGRGPEKIQIRENGVVIFYLDELEKFAELIVRECADVAVFKGSGMIATADVAGYMAAGRSTAARLIKEHFGVGE